MQNDEELLKLETDIYLSGEGIYFGEYDTASTRDTVEADLGRRLRDKAIEVVFIEASDSALVETLLQNEKETGKKKVFFVHTPTDTEKLIKFAWNLNYTRALFEKIKSPVVIWASCEGLRIIAENAPDFWAWRSRVVSFGSAARSVPHGFEVSEWKEKVSDELIASYEDALLKFESRNELKEAGKVSELLGELYFRNGEWEKAIGYYQKSLGIKEKIGDEYGAAQTYGNLGNVRAKMGEWKQAIELFQKGLETFEKLGDVHGAAQTYNNLGLVYSDMGEWIKAIDYYRKSIAIKEKLGDAQGAAHTFNNLGLVYGKMNEWTKAIELYQKSLETFEKLGDIQGAAQTYGNLGSVYVDMGEWTKAIEFHKKDLEISEKLGDLHGAAQTYNNLGLVYASKGEWDKAIEYYQKSLETFENLGDIHGATCANGNLGLAYVDMGEWNKAIKSYEKSLEKFEKLGDIHGSASAYGNLGSVYAVMGDWPKAIEFYRKDMEISEKLGDINGKGITLANLGKLHLDKKPPDPEKARKYLEDSIKFLNMEARPEYPNTLNWLALCYHRLGSEKKGEAKRENDRKKKNVLVVSASKLFYDASLLYEQVSAMPRVNLPSLKMYVHLDKGLSFSVKDITEEDEKIAIELLDQALFEFKKALEFADEKEKIRLLGVISNHEAKWYIRRAAVEEDHDKRDHNLDKAIEALEDAALQFKKIGDDENCNIKTCEGCAHLFSGLKLFREGIKEYTELKSNKAFNASLDELEKARKCYEDGESELGADTIDILKHSFKFVEEHIKSKDALLVTLVAPEFNRIIEELSAVGLRKMVKMYTFDEGMNVKEERDESRRSTHFENVQNVIYSEGDSEIGNVIIQPAPPPVPAKPDSLTDKLANPATLAGFVGWAAGLVFMIYGYAVSNVYSLIIGFIVFIVLAAIKLKEK